jgi:phage tail sheath protein FI
MPEYLAPGVFVEEIERGPKPIEGVATSTCAFLGETERGPVKPRLITNYNDYLRIFGDVFGNGKFMPYAVKAFFDNGGRRTYITRIVGANNAISQVVLGDFTVTAIGPGVAGDRIWARIGPGSTIVNGNPVGFRLQVFYWDRLPAGAQPFDPIDNPDQLPRPAISEDFDDMSVNPEDQTYFGKRLGDPNNSNSSFVSLSAAAGAALPNAAQGGQLQGGADGDAVTVVEYVGANAIADLRTGLEALNLDPYREVAIVHAPNAEDAVVAEVVTHCQNNRFRFAVIDSPADQGVATNLDPRNNNDTQYAAFYYPWIFVSDPRSGDRRKIPPGGAVCGLYALTDNTRGVFKAPANVTVAGAIDLEYDIDHGTQEVLNPRGVNVIRRFPGRGIRVWGARTLSSDPLWKYVSVRRLFIFIEASIYNSTQWVVFEPNDQKLWARVKQTVTLFLRTQWREGALFGAKEEEAFTVAIGRETMTEDDILNGRLIIEVGIAPVRPAEFVIFRVYQKTQEAKS